MDPYQTAPTDQASLCCCHEKKVLSAFEYIGLDKQKFLSVKV